MLKWVKNRPGAGGNVNMGAISCIGNALATLSKKYDPTEFIPAAHSTPQQWNSNEFANSAAFYDAFDVTRSETPSGWYEYCAYQHAKAEEHRMEELNPPAPPPAHPLRRAQRYKQLPRMNEQPCQSPLSPNEAPAPAHPLRRAQRYKQLPRMNEQSQPCQAPLIHHRGPLPPMPTRPVPLPPTQQPPCPPQGQRKLRRQAPLPPTRPSCPPPPPPQQPPCPPQRQRKLRRQAPLPPTRPQLPGLPQMPSLPQLPCTPQLPSMPQPPCSPQPPCPPQPPRRRARVPPTLPQPPCPPQPPSCLPPIPPQRMQFQHPTPPDCPPMTPFPPEDDLEFHGDENCPYCNECEDYFITTLHRPAGMPYPRPEEPEISMRAKNECRQNLFGHGNLI